MTFILFIAQCEVLDNVRSRISVCFGRGSFSVFPFLENSEIAKITLDFKINAFVFRGIGIFWTLVFCKFCVEFGVF